MSATQAVVEAVQKALGCREYESSSNGEHYCAEHQHLWLEHGCQEALVAARAAAHAARPAIRAEALREAADKAQRVYDMQCPVVPANYVGNAAVAHRWWETVLGGTLRELREQADREERA